MPVTANRPQPLVGRVFLGSYASVAAGSHSFGPARGLRIHTVNAIPAADIDATNGLRSSTQMRTAVDLVRWAPNVSEAVVLLDAMLSCGAVRLDRLRQGAADLPQGRRLAQIRQAVQLADPCSESPQESRMRIALVLGGLPTPEPQYEVRHAGRFVARVDLAYPQHRLAIEYDGRWHDSPHQFGPDRRRLRALAAAGRRVLPVTAADLYDVPRLVAAVRIALLGAVS